MTTSTPHPISLCPPSRLMVGLEEVQRVQPLERKILVAPSINWAREALRQLGLRTGGWVGWEAATLRTVATGLALVPLSEAGKRAGSDIEIGALIGEALDQVIADGVLEGHAGALAARAGFRQAIVDGILELRVAGIAPDALHAATGARGPGASLAPILRRYLALLHQRPFTDAAGVFEAALVAFDTEAPWLLEGRLVLAPGLGTRGLPGRLCRQLMVRGATLLESQPPAEPPALRAAADLFVAAAPADEVREALRRAVEEGYRLDQVELVATDPDTYGVELDALARHLQFPGTMLLGVPLGRSRAGRTLQRWLEWLEQGLPADLLRELIEAGDLAVAGQGTDGATLARAFRSLRIGWGRERTEAALHSLRNGGWVQSRLRGDDPTDDDAERTARRTRLEETASDLALLLERLLAITPPVPERGSATHPSASVGVLAGAAVRLLDLVPYADAAASAESFTASRLRNRLALMAEVPCPERPFAMALAGLRDLLADVRVWTDASGLDKPWSSRGGAVHLTDLVHAGLTGRPRTFVLGLDADRTGGPRLPDPLLPERVRDQLGAAAIATMAVRREEHHQLVAGALAGLTGRVTLSYATASDLAGHEAGPAPILLDIARQLSGRPDLSYSELREVLGAPAGAVPGAGRAPLDGRDGWLAALTDGSLLLDGTREVLRGWPGLARGVQAFTALERMELSPHLGLVVAAAGLHDPTRSEHGISPSSLEKLAACPLAWFYQYVLGLELPDDPAYDPSFWLDALQRGALLHEVYREFLRAHFDSQDRILDTGAAARLEAIVSERVAEWIREVPPPSITVLSAEERELRGAARSFLEMEREALQNGADARWQAIEQFIDPHAARFALPDGSGFALRGRIDRIDRLKDETLVVIDYKTGSARRYREDPKEGLFHGGRHLQPALYAAGAEQLFGARVSRFEYRFPTAKGQNDRAPYPAALLARAPALILHLLEHVREGAFVPTNDADDCRYCEFGSICRVREGWGKYARVSSPRAEWAGRASGTLSSLVEMARRRQ